MSKTIIGMFAVFFASCFIYGESDTSETADADHSVMTGQPGVAQPSSLPEKRLSTVKDTGASQGLEIPSGILFGKFERENGPFIIKGSLIVPAGEILEFGPGCKVLMANYSTITVFGQLIARGARDDPVVFQSANKTPNPWDWDRIYCRSRTRSVFEHCIVRHSNYGIYVENGSASIENCMFERNSLHGLVVKNADVTVKNSSFSKGHVLALFCLPGAEVRAESLYVNGNITGTAFCENARFELNGGSISYNTNGCVVMRGASVSMVGADITRNKTGIVAQREIPRNMCEMSYGNDIDRTVVDAREMEQILRAPEGVKSIVLPKASAEAEPKTDLKPGFAAIKAPREETSSFIGNVTAGFRYFSPHSKAANDTFVYQTRYPGENESGLQPELQVFANGKKNNADVDVLVDVYGNEYMGFRRNMTTLSLNYANQSVVLGDFYENFSETSISGRKMTGLKFDGRFLEMGRGTKRVAVQAAFGQSEMAKEVGGHELDLYNDTVDSGMSIRQQMTYVASVIYKPNFISSIGVKGIIARDQAYNPLFAKVTASDPKAPGLIEAQTGCIDAKVDLLNGKLSIVAEVDMGDSNTISENANPDEMSKIAWYDPQIPEAIRNVFSAIPTNRNYSASLGALGLFRGYDMNLNFTQIGQNYFSAGNPYLELDGRTLSFSANKEFSQKLSGDAGVEYQRRAIHSISPTDNSTTRLNAKYAFGENLPEMSLGYTLNYETSPKSEDDPNGSGEKIKYTFKDIKHLASLEGKQRLMSGIDYSVRYQVLYENDFTGYADTADMNRRDGLQHQVYAWLAFKAGKILRNKITGRVSTQKRHQDTLNGVSYKIGDEVRLTLLPRKLTCNIKGEYGKRVDNKHSSRYNIKRNEITKIKDIEAEVKYTITPKASLSIMDRYETNDDTETFSDNYTAEIFGMHFTYLF
jgi:hypothetical protein